MWKIQSPGVNKYVLQFNLSGVVQIVLWEIILWKFHKSDAENSPKTLQLISNVPY